MGNLYLNFKRFILRNDTNDQTIRTIRNKGGFIVIILLIMNYLLLRMKQKTRLGDNNPSRVCFMNPVRNRF